MKTKIEFRPFTCAMMALAVIGFALPSYAEGDVQREGGKGAHKQKMLEKFDTDKSGTISKAEFLTEMEGKFAEIDADGNAELSQDEMKAHHEAKREKMKAKMAKFREKGGGFPDKIESNLGGSSAE